MYIALHCNSAVFWNRLRTDKSMKLFCFYYFAIRYDVEYVFVKKKIYVLARK